ncbi:Asp23/Gls24 family envelope stress response protein [Lapidilactobacillus gannanensis]|uniref:Stress response regulator gls24 homolog n=1 Tax=Lapidilactobacillus gannanensis TaxID=2486002 RepID=A0ABW4BN17_9LACO
MTKDNQLEKKHTETTTQSKSQKQSTTMEQIQGHLTYDDKVVQKIVGTAIENIDGLLDIDGGFFANIADKLVNTDNITAGIKTEVGEKQVAVDMDVIIEYGRDIPEIADKMKHVIHDEVAKMTHLEVIEVNINVVDIKTKAEHEAATETVQDKVTNAAKSTGKFATKQSDKAKEAVQDGAAKLKETITDDQETRVQ